MSDDTQTPPHPICPASHPVLGTPPSDAGPELLPLLDPELLPLLDPELLPLLDPELLPPPEPELPPLPDDPELPLLDPEPPPVVESGPPASVWLRSPRLPVSRIASQPSRTGTAATPPATTQAAAFRTRDLPMTDFP